MFNNNEKPSRTIRIVIMMGFMVALAGIIGFVLSSLNPLTPFPSTSRLASIMTPQITQAVPTELWRPTPFPTYILPAMTPVPTGWRPPTPTLGPTPTYSTPPPSEPFILTVVGEKIPNTSRSTSQATFVVIGIVKQVLPARWTTPDGRRPANPHASTNQEIIFTPVLLEVEQAIKGQPSQLLYVFAFGGTMGLDRVERTSDDVDKFTQGERVMAFLAPEPRGLNLNNNVLWRVIERYTVRPDGQVENSHLTLPLDKLMLEIREAIRP